jgi:hypothetical protein
MAVEAHVWKLPKSRRILITDRIDLIPPEIMEINPEKTPALTYPPECCLGRFPTWQEGLTVAQQQAAETGFAIVEEKLCLVWEIDIPAWLTEGVA